MLSSIVPLFIVTCADDGNLVLYALECSLLENTYITRADCSDHLLKYLENYRRERSPIYRLINKVSNHYRHVHAEYFPKLIWQSNTAVRWKELLQFQFGKFYFYADSYQSLNIRKGKKVKSRFLVLFDFQSYCLNKTGALVVQHY